MKRVAATGRHQPKTNTNEKTKSRKRLRQPPAVTQPPGR